MDRHPARDIPPHLDPLDRQLPAERVLIRRVARPSGFAIFRPRGRRDLLMSITEDGLGQAGTDRVLVDTAPRSVALWQPDIPQVYRTHPTAAGWTQVWIHVQPPPHWRPWLDWPGEIAGFAVMHDLPDPAWTDVLHLMNEAGLLAWRHPEDPRALREDRALACLEHLLICLAAVRRPGGQAHDRRIAAALDLIHGAPDQPWPVRDLAAKVGLSESRFAHLFRAATGRSVQTYIEDIRLRHARDLIRTAGMSIQDAARTCGFCNAGYFTARFKRAFGVSPRQMLRG
jgi:AraC family transcriptional regulator of arabinose operon